jgi:hypothetical protein
VKNRVAQVDRVGPVCQVRQVDLLDPTDFLDLIDPAFVLVTWDA